MQIVLRLSIFLLFTISINSCDNINKTGQLQLQRVTASLEKSNSLIEASSQSNMDGFKNRLSNPYQNTEYAKDYFSKAEAVYKITDSVIGYLNTVKAKLKNKEQINMTNNDWSALYKTLKDYRTNVLQIDTNARNEFDNHLEIINSYFDSTNNNSESFIRYFFENTSINGAIATITAFQNNILIAELDINGYFNKKCLVNYCGYSQIWPLVSQDKSYVKAGENIEITAGIGAFTTTVKPIIKVNGTKVAINAEGFSVYKFKASPKLGQHSIPLEVEFIDFSGKKTILEKQMQYTVINFDSTLNKE